MRNSLPLFVADLVWPALYLSTSYWSWWVIVAGLLIELPVVMRAFKMPLRRAIIADLVMNAVSAGVGMLLLALAGVVWEMGPGILLDKFFSMGTFNPVTWVATFLIAVVITTGIEWLVLRFGFRAPATRGAIALLALANLITVALAVLEMKWHPPRM